MMDRKEFLRLAGRMAYGGVLAGSTALNALAAVPLRPSATTLQGSAGSAPGRNETSPLATEAIRTTAPLHPAGPPLLTMLYTNDTHARHEPFPETARLHRGLGGAVRRSRLIEAIRAEGQPVLLMDAGDFFQGTPWFHAFEGRIEMEMLSALGYNAITLGNHDFDLGTERFAQAAEGLGLPFVSSNLDLSATPMKDLVRNTIVRKLPNGLRVGIFGLCVDLKDWLADDLYEGVVIWDPIVRANAASTRLRRDYRCDLVVCLSHLGYSYPDDRPSDRSLVPNTSGIDIVIGGHTHTALDVPDRVVDSRGRSVLVTQAGHSGIRLGRIDVYDSKMLDGEGASGFTYRCQQMVVADQPIGLQETWFRV